jgi:hypothetical protein
MKRAVLAFIAGILTWTLVVSVLNRGLRMTLDGYAAAEPHMTFTLGMMAARLAMAALTSLIAGAVVGWVAPSGTRVPWILGAITLAAFLPAHVRFWSTFPLWYHLTFLVTLIPLIVLGSRLVQRRTQGSGIGRDGHQGPETASAG